MVRKAYRPSHEKLAWARRSLAASRSERGAFAFPKARWSTLQCSRGNDVAASREAASNEGVRSRDTVACVRDRSDSSHLGHNGEAPVLRRAEAGAAGDQLRLTSGFPGGMCCERRTTSADAWNAGIF